jgi:hypothetical protein
MSKSFQEEEWEARSWWFTPVIIATQEAEIRRIEVRSQPSLRDPILKRAGGVAQGEGPEFKPHYHTHTKKRGVGGRLMEGNEPNWGTLYFIWKCHNKTPV